jgi:hypothetical protein
MTIDWTAPGHSAFWTKTFHAALTGYAARGDGPDEAINNAMAAATDAETALTKAEVRRVDEKLAAREQRRLEVLASAQPGRVFVRGGDQLTVDRVDGNTIVFTDKSWMYWYDLADCGWTLAAEQPS